MNYVPETVKEVTPKNLVGDNIPQQAKNITS